jgi:hypothetical protein
MFCKDCGNQISDDVTFCPKCGSKVNKEYSENTPKTSPLPPPPIAKTENISLLLGLGIIFMPYVFSWFTLKRKYSSNTRKVAFIWMGLLVFVYAVTSIGSSIQDSNAQAEAKEAAIKKKKEDSLKIVGYSYNEKLTKEQLSWYFRNSKELNVRASDHEKIISKYCEVSYPEHDSVLNSAIKNKEQTSINSDKINDAIAACKEYNQNFLSIEQKMVKVKSILDARSKEIAKKNKALNEAAKSVARKLFGETLRNRYLDDNLDIKVTVYGKNNTKIKLTYVLFGDVWSHKMQSSDAMSQIQELGFKSLEMSDGYNWGVSWDLSK